MPNTASKALVADLAANKRKWDNWHESCRQEAEIEFTSLKDNALFISGIMLYWGEGDKVLKNGIVRLSNSDPRLVKVFYKFLKDLNLADKNKIFLKLILYPDLDNAEQQVSWSKSVGMPVSHFKKTIFINGRHLLKHSQTGIASIEVYSRKLKEKMLKWIELYSENF